MDDICNRYHTNNYLSSEGFEDKIIIVQSSKRSDIPPLPRGIPESSDDTLRLLIIPLPDNKPMDLLSLSFFISISVSISGVSKPILIDLFMSAQMTARAVTSTYSMTTRAGGFDR